MTLKLNICAGFPMNALKSIAFFFLFLVGLELTLRLIGFVYNTGRPFAFTGLRGAAGGTVLCLGDSYTYGGNVAAREAYPYQLWKMLNGTENPGSPGVTVINMGHCEYNSSQVLDELSENIRKYTPKVVVLLAGSSDRWNNIDADTGNRNFIYDRGYNSSLENTRRRSGNHLQNLLFSLDVYRIYRSITLDLKFRRLLRETRKISSERLAAGHKTAKNRDSGAAGYLKDIFYDRLLRETDGVNYERLAADYKAKKVSDYEMAVYFEAMFYNNRYEKLFSLALDSLDYISPSPDLYQKNLSYLFVLAASFDFQDRYGGAEVVGRLNTLAARKPALASDETFVKYLDHFRKKTETGAKSEKRLARNLELIAETVSKSGARLIIANYPAAHISTNRVLEAAAKKHNAVLIDNYSVFEKLIRTDGREEHLMGDDHATPLGHLEMAALLLPEIKKALE